MKGQEGRERRFIMKGIFMSVAKGFKYSYLIFNNLLSETSSDFKRLPEPSSITDEQSFVDDYNRASQSIMMLPYVLVLEMIHRVQGEREIAKAIDLCCGPGHFTRLLAKQSYIKEATGLDLSAPMLEYARDNAVKENLSQKMDFRISDVTKLVDEKAKSYDLVTFLNGAHHFNSIEDVKITLVAAERIVKDDGVIIVLDPVRQKNKKISDLYYQLSGEDYVRKGMSYFNIDFYNSLLASWRTDEFFTAIPNDSTKEWVQVIPFGVPTFQLLIGIPKGKKELFTHGGLTSSAIKSLIPKESLLDWKMLRLSFKFAKLNWKN